MHVLSPVHDQSYSQTIRSWMRLHVCELQQDTVAKGQQEGLLKVHQ